MVQGEYSLIQLNAEIQAARARVQVLDGQRVRLLQSLTNQLYAVLVDQHGYERRREAQIPGYKSPSVDKGGIEVIAHGASYGEHVQVDVCRAIGSSVDGHFQREVQEGRIGDGDFLLPRAGGMHYLAQRERIILNDTNLAAVVDQTLQAAKRVAGLYATYQEQYSK